MTMSFNFLVGSIVGGITSISGALIGALFITFVPDWSSDINLALSGVIYGACMIVMMLVARDGVVGLVRDGYARLRPFFTTMSRKSSLQNTTIEESVKP
jgi:branched-chain amino acid transport system permease protein